MIMLIIIIIIVIRLTDMMPMASSDTVSRRIVQLE